MNNAESIVFLFSPIPLLSALLNIITSSVCLHTSETPVRAFAFPYPFRFLTIFILKEPFCACIGIILSILLLCVYTVPKGC